MADLTINGLDALDRYGAHMGSGFISTLLSVGSYKQMPTSNSRLENGKRYVVVSPKIDSRDITLTFVIIGDTPSNAVERLNLFIGEMTGRVDICIPPIGKYKWHLIVQGVTNITTRGRRLLYEVSVKLSEPNPCNRV